MKKYLVVASALSALTIVQSAVAQTLTGNLLLRQATVSNAGGVNQIFSDFPTFSTVMGSLFTVSGGGWKISDIQIIGIGSTNAGATANNWFGNVNTAVLTISRQTSGAPDASVDPTVVSSGASIVFSGNVAITLDQGSANSLGANQNFRIVANTSGIAALQNLAAGNYVASLGPNTSFAANGQVFTAEATATGVDDYVRNTGGGFALPTGTAWGTINAALGSPAGSQWGIGINGTTVPEPASMSILGMGALALLRRRRKA